MTSLPIILMFINFLLLSSINEGDARGDTLKREGKVNSKCLGRRKAKGFIYPDDFYLLLKAQQLRNENVLVQPRSAPIHQKIKREAQKTLENEKLSHLGKH